MSLVHPVLPDLLQGLVDFLTDHTALVPLHGGRVGTKLQSELAAVRITSLGGPQPWPWESQPQYAIEWWGARADADEGPALTLTRAGEAALWELVGAAVGGGRVTGMSMPLSQLWSPDEDTGRARFRTDISLIVMP